MIHLHQLTITTSVEGQLAGPTTFVWRPDQPSTELAAAIKFLQARLEELNAPK